MIIQPYTYDGVEGAAEEARLTFAEATARAQGLPRIELFTNVHMTENRSLYPALGYREFARRTEDGFERVYFSKPIPAAP